ncbi:phenoxazinone synthase [Pseudonocardiaceae bacterium YIM PH 21723]|nr:phenoxazinone synthase [Pseudonocardiaceae bacterium YIM PH 21723]
MRICATYSFPAGRHLGGHTFMSIDFEPTTEIAADNLTLAPYVDKLPIPKIQRPGLGGDIQIHAKPAMHQFHRDLQESKIWGYEGTFPGPTIEVQSGQLARIDWINCVPPTEAYPVKHVENKLEFPGYDQPGQGAGLDGPGVPDTKAEALKSWLVTHVHGQKGDAHNDGWAFNATKYQGVQRTQFPNNQAACANWYHDHAMSITSLNVMAGLAGMYIIRDQEEKDLNLPRGKYEVPLVLADRNFMTEGEPGNRKLTPQLLHKQALGPNADEVPPGQPPVIDIPVAFYGPFNTVNGKITPYHDVEARWYRFRVLNAAHSRFYGLKLFYEYTTKNNNVPVPAADLKRAVKLIGTDSGLLGKPMDIPEDGLILGSAERVDLLIDFSVFKGKRIKVINVGSDNPQIDPFNAVMEFRVSPQTVIDTFKLPDVISKQYYRVTHDTPPGGHHGHRWAVLADPTNMMMIWEMVELHGDEAQKYRGKITDGIIEVDLDGNPATETTVLRRVAVMFEDALTFFINEGDWEQWRFLNLTDFPHPMHMHLVRFQALERRVVDDRAFIRILENGKVIGGGTDKKPVTFRTVGPNDGLLPHEIGWKDTVRVDGTELVSVMSEFEGGTGTFMYHCHILDHEDDSMMRPFAVMPKEVLEYHPMDHGHGGHHPGLNNRKRRTQE